VIGIVALVYGSLGVFTQMHSSLHRIWRLPPPPTQGIIARVIKTNLIAFLMVQVTCIFVLLLLSTTTVLTLLVNWWSKVGPGDGWTWHVGDFLLSTLLITVLIAFTFRFMSDGRINYRHVWGGALVSALLFNVGKMLIGYYLARVHMGSAFGAAGSLVVFLTWVYYSAHSFFFGAEVVRARLNP
jgi:membrane protein